jgi:hypothetical protein
LEEIGVYADADVAKRAAQDQPGRASDLGLPRLVDYPNSTRAAGESACKLREGPSRRRSTPCG